MRLWLSKRSEFPIRVQLEAQIILGIVSNDLKAGQRLPSTRELARRHKIHSNTVSAVYRQLASKGWVDSRKGSGVYVRGDAAERSLDGNVPLDRLISFFLNIGLDRGQSLQEIQSQLRRWLSLRPPDQCSSSNLLTGAAPIAMFRQADVVRSVLPPDTYLITLRFRSVSESLKGEKRPPA